MDRQFSLKEISRMLGIPERTVRHWVIAGQLKALRPTSQGFVIRVKASELSRFLKARDIERADSA